MFFRRRFNGKQLIEKTRIGLKCTVRVKINEKKEKEFFVNRGQFDYLILGAFYNLRVDKNGFIDEFDLVLDKMSP